MPKNLDDPVEWFFLALLFAVILIGAMAASNAEKALDDPNDKSRVFLDQLPAIALLAGAGHFHVRILRQSGYLHAEYEVPSGAEAISRTMATFRHAKIDTICISVNSATELHFNRLFYSHHGASEGKKVCSVEIMRIG